MMSFSILPLIACIIRSMNRYRLYRMINIYVNRSGCLHLHRSCNSVVQDPVMHTFQNRTKEQENLSTIDYSIDKIVLSFSEVLTQVEIDQQHWHSLDRSQIPKLHNICPQSVVLNGSRFESPLLFFVSRLLPRTEQHLEAGFQVEDRCIPLTWREVEHKLEILFACPQCDFVQFICDWIENDILYRNFFRLADIKTVTVICHDFDILNSNAKALLKKEFMRRNTMPRRSVGNDVQRVSDDSVNKGLEQLCLSDILSARNICKSLSEHTALNSSTAENTSLLNESFVVTSQPLKQNSLHHVDGAAINSHSSTFIEPDLAPSDRSCSSETLSRDKFNQSNPSHVLSPVEEGAFPKLLHTWPFLGNGEKSSAKTSHSMTSLSRQHRDEKYYARNSCVDLYKSRTFERFAYGLDWSSPVFRCQSLSSIGLTDCRTSRHRHRAISNSEKRRSFYDNMCQKRWSTSVPALDPAERRSQMPPDGIQFRRLSMLPQRRIFKPPNILVYCGKDAAKSSTVFKRVKNSLAECLDTESRYVVYKLDHEKFMAESSIWNKTVACLILVDLEYLDDKHWEKLYAYFENGGKLLFLCENNLIANLLACECDKKRYGLLRLAFDEHLAPKSSVVSRLANSLTPTAVPSQRLNKFLKKLSRKLNSFDQSIREQTRVDDRDGRLKFLLSVLKEPGQPLIFYLQHCHQSAGALFTDTPLSQPGLLTQIFERLGLEAENRPSTKVLQSVECTPGYLIFENDDEELNLRQMLLSKTRNTLNSFTLHFKLSDGMQNGFDEICDEQNWTIFCDQKLSHPIFNENDYFSHLTTKTLGRSVVFIQNITSTLSVFPCLRNSCPEYDGFMMIAQRQSSGRGRSDNRWLSPIGCAMFTFSFRTDTGSKVASFPGFVQHLLALAEVDSIRSLDGFQSLDLRIKWPNDVYYGRNTKIGGVLADCCVTGDKMNFTLSSGFNVANSSPTLCLNDLLPQNVDRFTCEHVIALIVSRFEQLVAEFESNGPEFILPLYYKYWLHDHQELTLAEGAERVVVRGLDRHGFLQVSTCIGNKLISVQPDGNSLDMLHNLIRTK